MLNKGLENAKALTYTTLFAVVPLITLVFAILSLFPSFQVFGSQIQELIFSRLVPSSSTELENYLSGFASQARNLSWIGGLILLVTALMLLVNVEKSFNRIWGVRESRKGLSSFLLYWSVLSLGPLLLGVGFGISSYITSMTVFDAFIDVSDLMGASSLLLQLFPIVLTTGAFTLLFVAVPNCGVRFRHGFAGGLAVALSFILVKKIFTGFIASSSYELVYGTFAAIPIFLMWIYLCWVVILIGANLVRAIPLFSVDTINSEVHPFIMVLALLHKFWDKNQRGETLTISELLSAKWPFRTIQVEVFLDLLCKAKIIRACSQTEYVLSRDLYSLSLWEVFSNLPWPMPLEKDLQGLPFTLEGDMPAYASLKTRFAQIEEFSGKEFSDSVGSFFRQAGS
jgi:membrane protein